MRKPNKKPGFKPRLTARTKRFLQRAKNRTARMQAKSEVIKAKNELNTSRLGLRGNIARKKALKQAEVEAKIQMAQSKPEIYKKGRMKEIETEAKVRTTKARGAAAAGVASALGGSYSVSSTAKAEAEKAKAKAEEEAAKAIQSSVGSVGTVETTYNQPSASGLVTGVR